jgi:hypothetical protein
MGKTGIFLGRPSGCEKDESDNPHGFLGVVRPLAGRKEDHARSLKIDKESAQATVRLGKKRCNG